ncbi:hypothetical protein [Shimia aestuarii]|uniref:Uncharacterized protein n=1 Tax=Shimia aestuarii TaxID=254406 RepID=A0A1I4P152_9RHOB|nr:hypothetical protein [Shimia aestuarii]SFM21502.1 hypothetical protein SAMN04488042_10534 [Shimia aestuarii]
MIEHNGWLYAPVTMKHGLPEYILAEAARVSGRFEARNGLTLTSAYLWDIAVIAGLLREDQTERATLHARAVINRTKARKYETIIPVQYTGDKVTRLPNGPVAEVKLLEEWRGSSLTTAMFRNLVVIWRRLERGEFFEALQAALTVIGGVE